MSEELDRYKRKVKSPEQALMALMQLCSRSEKSSGDALRLMARWGVLPQEQTNVLSTLIKQRFIDDSRYAAAFVREKVRLSGWGVYKIRASLMAKGVSKDIIELELSGLDRDDMRERLERYMNTKLKNVKGTSYQIKGKLMRYGLSLGYDYESVANVVGSAIKDED